MREHASSNMIKCDNELFRVENEFLYVFVLLSVCFSSKGIPLATGQNLAMGFENWTEVLDHWIAEKEHYYHTFSSPNIFNRYTQVKTKRIRIYFENTAFP